MKRRRTRKAYWVDGRRNVDRVSASDKWCAVEVWQVRLGLVFWPHLKGTLLGSTPAVLVPWGNDGVDNVELGVKCKWTGVRYIYLFAIHPSSSKSTLTRNGQKGVPIGRFCC